MTKEEIVRDLAIKKICPLSMQPDSVYEHNMVKYLTQFGLAVLDAVEHSVQRTADGLCSECGKQLMSDGDCAYCN